MICEKEESVCFYQSLCETSALLESNILILAAMATRPKFIFSVINTCNSQHNSFLVITALALEKSRAFHTLHTSAAFGCLMSGKIGTDRRDLTENKNLEKCFLM